MKKFIGRLITYFITFAILLEIGVYIYNKETGTLEKDDDYLTLEESMLLGMPFLPKDSAPSLEEPALFEQAANQLQMINESLNKELVRREVIKEFQEESLSYSMERNELVLYIPKPKEGYKWILLGEQTLIQVKKNNR
jgi:hypothetical protein